MRNEFLFRFDTFDTHSEKSFQQIVEIVVNAEYLFYNVPIWTAQFFTYSCLRSIFFKTKLLCFKMALISVFEVVALVENQWVFPHLKSSNDDSSHKTSAEVTLESWFLCI